jgi:hypothetical protein
MILVQHSRNASGESTVIFRVKNVALNPEFSPSNTTGLDMDRRELDRYKRVLLVTVVAALACVDEVT